VGTNWALAVARVRCLGGQSLADLDRPPYEFEVSSEVRRARREAYAVLEHDVSLRGSDESRAPART
jgi:hypothetical protein